MNQSYDDTTDDIVDFAFLPRQWIEVGRDEILMIDAMPIKIQFPVDDSSYMLGASI